MIELEDGDGVRLIAFNRPEARNAFDCAMYLAVASALADARSDDGVRAVVLTGRGTAFSAGQDITEMTELAAGVAPEGTEQGFGALLDELECFDKPLLAAVNGAGIGLGFTLLAHCDLVLIAQGARLRAPFAAMGVPPEAGSSYLFPARMGRQRAAQVLLGGGWISAQDAVAWGLAIGQYPPDELLEEALSLARSIAEAPLGALVSIKRLLLEAEGPAVAAARRREEDAFAVLFAGMAAGTVPTDAIAARLGGAAGGNPVHAGLPTDHQGPPRKIREVQHD